MSAPRRAGPGQAARAGLELEQSLENFVARGQAAQRAVDAAIADERAAVAVDALARIADMRDRDGVPIDMHRDELRAIAKTALASLSRPK